MVHPSVRWGFYQVISSSWTHPEQQWCSSPVWLMTLFPSASRPSSWNSLPNNKIRDKISWDVTLSCAFVHCCGSQPAVFLPLRGCLAAKSAGTSHCHTVGQGRCYWLPGGKAKDAADTLQGTGEPHSTESASLKWVTGAEAEKAWLLLKAQFSMPREVLALRSRAAGVRGYLFWMVFWPRPVISCRLWEYVIGGIFG